MKIRYLLMGVIIIVSLAGLPACGSPTEAPQPAATEAPTEAPAPTEEPAEAPEPTDIPEPTAEPAPELLHFEDDAGVFQVDYLSDFSQIQKTNFMGNYGYNFANPDQEGSMIVAFTVVADEAVPDQAWAAEVDNYGSAMLETLAQGFDFEFTELKRQTGEGSDHSLYVDAESSDGQLRMAFQSEESDGVLSLIVFILPADQWASRETDIADSLASYSWSPQAARAAIVEEAGSAPQDLVSFVDPLGVFAIQYPSFFDNSQGPGMMENGRSYTYSVWPSDQPHYVSMFIDILADEQLSDEAWKEKAELMIGGGLSTFGPDAVETNRVEGETGAHWFLLQAESESRGTHALFLVEEIDGVLATVLSEIPSDEWPALENTMLKSMENFLWDPAAARTVIEAAAETQ